MSLPERDHVLEKSEHIQVRPQLAPVQPSDFVVLVIRIVVAVLRVQEFITARNIGMPFDSRSRQQKFLTCFRRSAKTESDAPSSPS
jgi:hypothetical protein